MGPSEIIIAAGNAEAGNKIRQVLVEGGFIVTGVCISGNEALRKVRTLKPALLLVNFELPDMSGFEVAKIIAGSNLCSVILLADDAQKGFVDSRLGDLDIVCLKRPVSRALLLNSAELTVRSRLRLQKLEAELQDMKVSLETRKHIDKAKGLLMDKLGISEQEAFRRIQKQSMDSCIPMLEVAKKIIENMR